VIVWTSLVDGSGEDVGIDEEGDREIGALARLEALLREAEALHLLK